MDKEAVLAFLATDEGKALVEASEAVSGLRTKRDELLSKQATMSEQLRQYQALGDLNTITQKLTAATETTTQAPAQQDDRLVAENTHLRTQLEEVQQSVTKREQALVSSFVDSALTASIAEAKGVVELLKGPLSQRVRGAFDEAGKVVIEVLNADGTPMFKGGKAATLADLVTEYKSNETFGIAFASETSSGSGARQAAGGRPAGAYTPGDKSFNLSKFMEKQKRAGQAGLK